MLILMDQKYEETDLDECDTPEQQQVGTVK